LKRIGSKKCGVIDADIFNTFNLIEIVLNMTERVRNKMHTILYQKNKLKMHTIYMHF